MLLRFTTSHRKLPPVHVTPCARCGHIGLLQEGWQDETLNTGAMAITVYLVTRWAHKMEGKLYTTLITTLLDTCPGAGTQGRA